MFDTDYPLTEQQIDSYREHGFVQLNDVVTGGELQRMRSAITGAVLDEVRGDKRAFAEKSAYEQVFIQRINLWARHKQLREFVLSRRFANIAARLSGCQVRIFHDHALYKEPRTGARTPWHQDTHYWPHQQKGNQLSLWLALSSDAAARKRVPRFSSRHATHRGHSRGKFKRQRRTAHRPRRT